MWSCGERSSHAYSNIIQQHLLKSDLQLLSQVRDGSSVLMTIEEASPWLSKCPYMASFLPVCPPGPLIRLIDYTVGWGSVRDMLQSPFLSLHVRCFISPLKNSSDQSTASELLFPSLTFCVAGRILMSLPPRVQLKTKLRPRTLHLQYTAGLHLFSFSSERSRVLP